MKDAYLQVVDVEVYLLMPRCRKVKTVVFNIQQC